MSARATYIASSNLPGVKDPELEWPEGKLNLSNRNLESFRGSLKTDFTKNMMSAEVTSPNLG